MRKGRFLGLLALAAAWGLNGGAAHAQLGFYVPPQTTPFNQPVVSPYLNLARGGSAGINYYGLVRPQLQTYEALQALGAGQAFQRQELNQLGGQRYLTSGHQSSFFNYSHYYPGFSGGIGGGSGQTAVQPNLSGVTPGATAVGAQFGAFR